MTKKLLALFLALSMILSVCAFSVYAEEAADGEGAVAVSEEGSSEPETQPATEPETQPKEEVKNSVSLSLENSYLANATVVIKGEVEGDVSGVIVRVICDEDSVEEEYTLNKSKFESTGVSFKLDDATVGAEYIVEVYNFDDEEALLAEDSFLIRKSNTSTSVDDGSNKVTIWIEGTSNRYLNETVVNLDRVKKPNVLEVCEYVLDEVGRDYKSSKYKVTAISSSATSASYTLKDGSTSSYFKNCEWSYILNGEFADYDGDWTDVELKGGDEIIVFYGEPGTVGYPIVEVSPDVISAKDPVTVTVTNRLFDEEGNIESEEPVKGAKIYLIKRDSTSLPSPKTTNASGEYTYSSSTVSSNWITTYQGGEIMVGWYQSSSKPLKMVTVKEDLNTDREGTVQAYVRIEGAHKTLLSRTKTAKIDEFDLYNFMIEVLEDEDIEYEVNDEEVNFTYFESKSTSGYSNENGDITRDSGWYVAVNDVIYTPEDDLEEVEIYSNDEIVFYFGDKDTVPVVYYDIDGELKTEKKVYVYFYSDANKTTPIEDLEVNFKGDDIDKDLETNSDGRITLPTVDYKGTYTLSWGDQVGLRDEECPKAVMGEAKLTFSGTAKPADDDDDEKETTTVKYECEYCDDEVTKLYTVEYKGIELDVCKSCKAEIAAMEEEEEWEETKPKDEEEENNSGWETGDYNKPEDNEFTPGPSKYYPDQNIDAWAVEYINAAYEYELMSGTTYGYFEPQRGITRAEFVTIICRILGLDTDGDNYNQVFTDVKPTDWHYGAVMAAYSAGYVTGKSATTFCPTEEITREEIAVIIYRITRYEGNTANVANFIDYSTISSWAVNGVASVNTSGIMTGDQFGQFMPKVVVNRQTAATIAVRLYEYLGLGD